MWSSKYGFLTSSLHDICTGLEGWITKAYKGENYVHQNMDYITQPRSQGDLLQYSEEYQRLGNGIVNRSLFFLAFFPWRKLQFLLSRLLSPLAQRSKEDNT